jgi:hypothetical protein
MVVVHGPTVPTDALRLSREVAEYHRKRHEALLGAGVCIGFGSLCGGLAAFLLFGAVFAGSWVLGALCAMMLILFCGFMRWGRSEIAEYRNLYEEYHHAAAARTGTRAA